MIEGLPWTMVGPGVSGLAVPCVGVPYGHGVHSVEGETARVEFALWRPGFDMYAGAYSSSHNGTWEAVDGLLFAQEAWLDGVHAATVEDGGQAFDLSGLRHGKTYELAVVPWSVVQQRQHPGVGALFGAKVRGDRVCLTWTDQPSETDFLAYVVYWDAGLGGDPDTELAVIRDLGTLTFVTEALAAGTYQFALAYRDVVGNESAVGDTVEATVAAGLPARTNFAIAYDSGTRKATLTWTNPQTLLTVRRLLVFDNALVGSGVLAAHANSDWGLRRDDTAASATSWESGELWAGTWRFDVRAMLGDGTLSPSVEAVLNLALNGSTLEEIEDPPATPELYDAEPLAAGAIRLRFRISDLTDVDSFEVVRDGAEVDTVAVVAGQLDYAYTNGSLTDGQEYAWRIRAYNGDAYSESGELSATADDSAPTGDGVLSAEVCW